MTRLILILILVSLACGSMPVMESTVLPPKVTQTPAPISTFTPESAEIRHITGCWNIRSTPGGLIIGVKCREDVEVLFYVLGWARIADGYICPRAWGAAAVCEVK